MSATRRQTGPSDDISCPIIVHRPWSVVGKETFDCLKGAVDIPESNHLAAGLRNLVRAGQIGEKMASCSHRSKPVAAAGETERSAPLATSIHVVPAPVPAWWRSKAQPGWSVPQSIRTGRRAVCIRKA